MNSLIEQYPAVLLQSSAAVADSIPESWWDSATG